MTRHLSVLASPAVRTARPPVLAGLLAALAACGPLPPPPEDKTAATPAPGPASIAPQQAAASADHDAAEAIVLIQDNKERCLKISRDGAKIMDDAAAAALGQRYVRSEESPRSQLRRYLDSEAKSESFLVQSVQDLIRQSLGKIDRNQQREVSILLRSLFEAQQQLCRAATRGYVSSVEDYRSEISASLYTYTQIEQKLNALVRVSDAERRKILLQHESALMAAAQAVGGSYRPMLMGGGNYTPVRQKSAEEWERERREYEEKLRRREQMQAEHQRSVGEWRNRDKPQEPLPTAGVSSRPTTVSVPVPKKLGPTNLLQEQMIAWHRDYAGKAYPVKLAIQRYLQARDTGDPLFLEPACHNLKDACDTLLLKRGILYAPDPGVKRDLEEAYTRFQMVGTTCRDDQVAAANRAFERANATMRTYGLRP